MRTYLLFALLLGLVESLPAGARSHAQGANLFGEWVFSVNMARSNCVRCVTVYAITQ